MSTYLLDKEKEKRETKGYFNRSARKFKPYKAKPKQEQNELHLVRNFVEETNNFLVFRLSFTVHFSKYSNLLLF